MSGFGLTFRSPICSPKNYASKLVAIPIFMNFCGKQFHSPQNLFSLQPTWMRDTIELVQHVTLWNSNSLFSHLRWCGPLHLAFLGTVAYACTNIQEEEEEEDTPHIDTWDNGGCGLTSLVVCINGKTRDIRERTMTTRSDI